MKLFLVVIAVVAATVTGIPVHNGALIGIRQSGLATISAVVKNLNADLTAAVGAFKPINTTCTATLNQAISTCSSCVRTKCEARAKSECKPNDLEKVLGKAVKIVKDASEFIHKKVPDFIIKELPNKLIDLTKDIHGFIKDDVIGRLDDVAKGAIDLGKGLGKGVIDVGTSAVKEIGRTGERIGKEAGRVVESVGKEIGRAGERIGKEVGRVFRRIFGKRSLRGAVSSRSRRSEPGCGTFEKDPEGACLTYMKAPFCPTCGFDPTISCPGYTAALKKIEEVQSKREWLMKASSGVYNILSMTFDMGPQGQFLNIKATVDIFGKQFTLSLGAINPYMTDQAGPAVANAAMDMFKKSVA